MIKSPHSHHNPYMSNTPHTPRISNIPSFHPFNNLNKLLINQRKLSTDYIYDKKHNNLSSPQLLRLNVGYDNIYTNGFISPRGFQVNNHNHNKPIYNKIFMNENNKYTESIRTLFAGFNNYILFKDAATPSCINVDKVIRVLFRFLH